MYTLHYKGKKKTVYNIEKAIEVAKELPPGEVVIRDGERVVWERIQCEN